MNKIHNLFCAFSAAAVVSAASLAAANGAAAAANSKAPTNEAAFEQLVDDFVFGTLTLSPSTATGVGYHQDHNVSLDDLLDDFSPTGIAAAHSLLHDIEARIA